MPVPTTRHQQYFAQALEHVTSMQNADESVRNAYGGLCHAIPLLVRNDGFAQTVAWVQEKASADPPTPLSRAYAALRDQMTAFFGFQNVGLVRGVLDLDMLEYTQKSLAMLEAWVYYKRFAGSVLGIVDASVDPAMESGVRE